MALEIAHFCRVRHLKRNFKKLGGLLLLLTLLVYLNHESEGLPPSQLQLQTSPDQVLAMQAELGYLRQKLASCPGLLATNLQNSIDNFTPIIVITPTYTRPVQKAELTRLKNVFLLVPNLHWILVEDAGVKSDLVTRFLKSSGLSHTHLNFETPSDLRLKSDDPHWSKPRGVLQRNMAITWLRENKEKGVKGVVYFADDDNTYSTELFEAIRGTKKVGVLSVGLVGGVMVERPQVVEGVVTGWAVGWGRSRPYATDMAGFAVNLAYLLTRPSAKFPTKCKRGHLESEFLKHLVAGLADLEPISTGQVMVWHTRTEQANLNKEKKFEELTGQQTDFGIEV